MKNNIKNLNRFISNNRYNKTGTNVVIKIESYNKVSVDTGATEATLNIQYDDTSPTLSIQY